MTNPWGGREPRAGMSRDRANMDTVLISQLDWRSLFCTDPCPVGNSETGPVGLRKRWSEGSYPVPYMSARKWLHMQMRILCYILKG